MTFTCSLQISDACVGEDLFDPAERTDAGEAVCIMCADVR